MYNIYNTTNNTTNKADEIQKCIALSHISEIKSKIQKYVSTFNIKIADEPTNRTSY